MKDKCTNRVHMLGTPPPTRGRRRSLLPRPLPRHGCMPCREFAKGAECPYRQAYDCDDDVKAVGRQLGHCVVERLYRDEGRDEMVKRFDLLEDQDRARAEHLVELYLDAYVYTLRAGVWSTMSFSRPIAEGGYNAIDEQYLRATLRYWKAGIDRRDRWFFGELKPYYELINDRVKAEVGRYVPRRPPRAAPTLELPDF